MFFQNQIVLSCRHNDYAQYELQDNDNKKKQFFNFTAVQIKSFCTTYFLEQFKKCYVFPPTFYDLLGTTICGVSLKILGRSSELSELYVLALGSHPHSRPLFFDVYIWYY